jgi:hypothetical protein
MPEHISIDLWLQLCKLLDQLLNSNIPRLRFEIAESLLCCSQDDKKYGCSEDGGAHVVIVMNYEIKKTITDYSELHKVYFMQRVSV